VPEPREDTYHPSCKRFLIIVVSYVASIDLYSQEADRVCR
jgi:hypothetical protein